MGELPRTTDHLANSPHPLRVGVDNADRPEVVQILAKHTTVKDLPLYDRIIPAGLDPDGRLNVAGMREDLTVFTRLGCVTGEVADVSRVVDESFVNYALSVLGPY